MKFKRTYKVQYKSEELSIKSEKRYLLYRIDPSELSIWQRLFCNKWTYVYRQVYTYKNTTNSIEDLLGYLFSYDQAVAFIKSYRTFGDLNDFLHKIYSEATEHYNKITKISKWDF